MGSKTRSRYSADFVYGLANHFPIIAKQAPCALLKAIIGGLHRIAAHLGLVSVMFVRNKMGPFLFATGLVVWDHFSIFGESGHPCFSFVFSR